MSSITLTFLDQILPPFGNAILGIFFMVVLSAAGAACFDLSSKMEAVSEKIFFKSIGVLLCSMSGWASLLLLFYLASKY